MTDINEIYYRFQTNVKRLSHCLCLGLDPDPTLLPLHYSPDLAGVRSFLFDVIEATSDLCVAFKPNLSFFECFGIDGIRLLMECRERIPTTVPLILDAKRGDIGNTSRRQAQYLFETLGADAVTLHPYMGFDSLEPFFEYRDKYSFVLALTSNPGAADFEKLQLQSGEFVYQRVVSRCLEWHQSYGNVGLVVGATQEEIYDIRAKVPQLLFLVPGVGAQGARYQDVVGPAMNRDGVGLVNVTRSILYASRGKEYLSVMRDRITDLCLH